jgi:hypothetical protein
MTNWGEMVHSEVCRMVVVKEGKKQCVCLYVPLITSFGVLLKF